MSEIPDVTVEVLYSCNPCGLRRVAVAVPARREDEDVVHWIEKTMAEALTADHKRRRPHCRATHISDVMIPTGGVDMIGGPRKQ